MKCCSCGQPRERVKQLVELVSPLGTAICDECVRLAADICGITHEGQKAESAASIEPVDMTLPTTTMQFAQYLNDIAEQIKRIPDRPIVLDPDNVEIGFYYENPMFPQSPTGVHFEINFASTSLRSTLRRRGPK